MKPNEVSKETIAVRFHLLGGQGNKVAMICVNKFIPLINYKRQIESQHKVDLYGRKLVFKA